MTVPLWTVAVPLRETVDPATLASEVVHYSIPALEATGQPAVEPSDTIKSLKLRVRGGELLVSKLNPRKSRVLLVPPVSTPTVASTEFVAFRPVAAEPRFLVYCLSAEPTRQLLDSNVRSVTRSHQRVEPEVIARVPIPAIPLDEQRRIADFLDSEVASIGLLMSATGSQVALLRRRHLEWLRQVTTGTEEGTTASTRIPWMPNVNRDWGLHRVSRVFKTGSGTTPTATDASNFGGAHPWVNTGDLRDGPVTATSKSVTDSALERFTTLTTYPPGSLLIAMYGATIGRTGMLRIPSTVNQACCVLYRETAVSAEFAWQWFIAHRPWILNLAAGAGQPNISQETIRGLNIPSPTLDLQRQIVATVRREAIRVASTEDALLRRVDLLTERRQAIITAAVTGQLDVTTARGGRS